jgi:integrase/recombinase XerD
MQHDTEPTTRRTDEAALGDGGVPGVSGQATRLRLVTSHIGGPPTVEEAWQEFVDELRLRGLSRHTVEWYQYVIRPFARFAETTHGPQGLAAVTEHDVRAFLRQVADQVGPRRLNHYIEGLRRFYEWLQGRGYADHNPAATIRKVREPRRIIPSLTEEQLRALLRQPDRSRFVGLRDYCFILALLDTGLRLSEALALRVADVEDDGVVKVLGKGAKERRVSLSRSLQAQLRPYLRARQAALETIGRPESPWLFPNDVGGKLTPRAIRLRLKQYAEAAGIRRVRVSPHTLRHTYAVNWVQNGGDVFTLQRTLGHSSLEMTRRYVDLCDAHVLQQQRELSPLVTMDLPLGGRRIPRKPMAGK